MTPDVLLCPDCRARVFGSWPECKFCGAVLRVERIDAAVDPDDLVSPVLAGDPESGAGADAPPPVPGHEASGPRSPWSHGWSSWAGSGEGSDTGSGSGGFDLPDASPPLGFDPAGGDVSTGGPVDEGWASEAGGTGPGSGAAGGTDWDTAATGSLVPVEGVDPTWVPGPAPSVGESESSSVLGRSDQDQQPGATWGTDEGPSGLEPADWYPDPGSTQSVDEPSPSGLEPADWYPDPGSTQSVDEPSPSGFEPSDRDLEAGPSHAGGLGIESASTDATFEGSGWDFVDAEFRSPDVRSDVVTETSDPGADGPLAGASNAEDTGVYQASDADSPQAPQSDFDSERFDPEAIFREPEPEPDVEDAIGSDLEPAEPGGEIAVDWQPAAADAWDVPVEPEGKPKGQALLSRESRLILAVILLLLVILLAGIGLRDRQADHPSQWSASVQQMADWVAKTRKLPFKHPVAVVTMNGNAYDAAVKSAGVPADSGVHQELADQVAMWRALAVIQGNPSARRNAVAAQQPELGAFYDLDAKRLVLRDGTDLASLRKGVAGALSVALDDQRTDLSSLQSTGISEDPLFDVVLGTAELMRSDYVGQQPKSGDAPAAQDSATTQADVESDFLMTRPAMQTRLGDPFVQIVRDVKDIAAANGLALSPPASSQQVMLPMAYFDGRGALAGPQPEAPEDAEKLGEGTIGAQTWYLLVASHLDDPAKFDEALDFADRWAGDSYVAYRKPDGKVCVNDVLRGSDESQTALISGALHAWRDAVPGDHIEVRAQGDHVTVIGCDPGASADQGLQGSLDTAVSAAVTRSELAAGYYLAGTKIPNGVNGPVFPPNVAWCMGREAVALAQPGQLASLATRKGSTYRDLTLAAAGRCSSNMADQLFVNHGD